MPTLQHTARDTAFSQLSSALPPLGQVKDQDRVVWPLEVYRNLSINPVKSFASVCK